MEDCRIEHEDMSLSSPDVENVQVGRWTVQEHELFLLGLKKHGRNWKLIQGLIKSRTATQVRTHAQKFFTRDNYQANKRGRYASRLKDIETPDMMESLRASGTLGVNKLIQTNKTSLQNRCITTTKQEYYNRSTKKLRHYNNQDDEDTEMEVVISLNGYPHSSSSTSSSTCSNSPEDDDDMMTATKSTITEENSASLGSLIKSEWHDFVEPLEFFSEVTPSSNIFAEQPATHSYGNEDDCLDWLANHAEPPMVHYYESFQSPCSDPEDSSPKSTTDPKSIKIKKEMQ